MADDLSAYRMHDVNDANALQASFHGLHQLTGAPTPPAPFLNGGYQNPFGPSGIGGPMSGIHQHSFQQNPVAMPYAADIPGPSNGGAPRIERRMSNASSSGSGQDASGSFEFTRRRKRWASLLVDELSASILLVLLPLTNGGAKVLYASPGVKDLLGHTPSDVEGRPLSDIVHPSDLPALLGYVHQSILTRTDLSSFHRFMTTSEPSAAYAAPSRGSSPPPASLPDSTLAAHPFGDRSFPDQMAENPKRAAGDASKSVLLELRGHGYWGEDAERKPLPLSLTAGPSVLPTSGNLPTGGERCKCFFLMARRWPSRTSTMIDTFMAEKILNERLRAEELELQGGEMPARDEHEGAPGSYQNIVGLHQTAHFPAASGPSHPATKPPALSHGYSSTSLNSQSYYDDPSISGGAYEDDDSDPDRQNDADELDPDSGSEAYVPTRPKAVSSSVSASHAARPPKKKEVGGAGAGTAGGGGAGPATKKAKRSKKSGKQDGNHVCVTCGRTDSPEWRKGPMGPKSLCNACGLRWKKLCNASGGVPPTSLPPLHSNSDPAATD